MEKMEGSRVKEMIDAKREDSARLSERVSKLQRQIKENDADIKTLQSRCPHEWKTVIETSISHVCIFCEGVKHLLTK